MLTMRRRGKNGIYYFRGSVALGTKRIDVKEFSAGTSDADAASHLIAQYETNLRALSEQMHRLVGVAESR